MKRGDLVTVALQDDLGKPRPALILQSDYFVDLASVTVLPISSELRKAPLVRIAETPSATNGLRKVSQVMIDKATTVARSKIGGPFGALDDATMRDVERSLAIFLGIAR